MWFYKPVQCEKCGADHKIAFSSRFIVSLIVLPIPIFGFMPPFNNVYINIMVGLCISFTVSLLIPFLVKYNTLLQEEVEL